MQKSIVGFGFDIDREVFAHVPGFEDYPRRVKGVLNGWQSKAGFKVNVLYPEEQEEGGEVPKDTFDLRRIFIPQFGFRFRGAKVPVRNERARLRAGEAPNDDEEAR